MKTNESLNTFTPLLPNLTQGRDHGENNAANKKDNHFYFDNANICLYYGQSNIEKCIFLLFFLVSLTMTLLFHYVNQADCLLFYSIVATFTADCLSLLMYCFLLLRLKSDNLFNVIPHCVIQGNDYLIVLNLIAKAVIFTLVCLNSFGVIPLAMFALKFLMDIYFTLVSVKLFLFCPGARLLQEQSEKMWTYVKVYFFCIEDQDQELNEYMKIEDIESFY